MHIPADAERYIHTRFPQERWKEAVSVPESAVIHDGTPIGPRLVRCIWVASKGNMGRLHIDAREAACDFRDVIMAGEYGIVNGKLAVVHNLTEPFTFES